MWHITPRTVRPAGGRSNHPIFSRYQVLNVAVEVLHLSQPGEALLRGGSGQSCSAVKRLPDLSSSRTRRSSDDMTPEHRGNGQRADVTASGGSRHSPRDALMLPPHGSVAGDMRPRSEDPLLVSQAGWGPPRWCEPGVQKGAAASTADNPCATTHHPRVPLARRLGDEDRDLPSSPRLVFRVRRKRHDGKTPEPCPLGFVLDLAHPHRLHHSKDSSRSVGTTE